jgi:polyketide synthase 12
MRLAAVDLDVLAIQLTAALDGPPLLFLSSDLLDEDAADVTARLGRGWEDLARRITGFR